ncbi:CoA-transferase family III domain-containing protein [Melanogaster broomeanus]|nr:CoA-transferase family III domain-containing protein [Melanogaster broomeanus]
MALDGLKVVEFAGLAPAPFAGLVLSHHGASVIRIDRPSASTKDALCEGKRSIILDTKNAEGLAIAKRLIAEADVLIDPFRPGVLERLGLGPEVFHSEEHKKGLNDKLIYARLAGFPRKANETTHGDLPGHDINYIALSGILSMLPGTKEKPSFPLNLLADFAGGGLLCATGILLALIERGKSGRGQVVNIDMVSGTRYISSFPLLNAHTSGYFSEPRGSNLLDGGAPFYGVYTCSDGKWMSLGCLEPQFFATFIDRFNAALRINGMKTEWTPTRAKQFTKDDWPSLRKYIEDGFKTMPRDYWADVFLDSDACAVPVLSPAEAASIDPSGSPRPAPHPDLSRTPASIKPGGSLAKILEPGAHNEEILAELGLSAEQRKQLELAGALGEEVREKPSTKAKL